MARRNLATHPETSDCVYTDDSQSGQLLAFVGGREYRLPLEGGNAGAKVFTASIGSDLRSYTGTSADIAFISGLISADDGQGGFFTWDTATAADDGVDRFNPPSGGTAAGWKRALRSAADTWSVVEGGALADGVIGSDGAIDNGLKAFTSAAAAFTAADVGKVITITGAGAAGEPLTTTIAAWVSATAVTVTDAAGGTVTGASYAYGTDNSAAFQTIINAHAGSRVLIPAGKFLLKSTISLPNKTRLIGSPGTTLIAALARAGVHAVVDLLYAAYTPTSTYDAAISADIAQWSLTFTCDQKPTVGTFVRIVSAPGTGGQGHSGIYEVISVAGVGAPYTVTVDRPIAMPYTAAGSLGVTFNLQRPSDVHIIGNGMVITGNASRYVEFLGCLNSTAQDIVFDSTAGRALLCCMSQDEGSQNCQGLRLHSKMTVGADSAPAYYFIAETNEDCAYVDCSGAGASIQGFMSADSVGQRFERCDVVGDGTNPPIGLLVDTLGLAGAASWNVTVSGGNYRGAPTGIKVDVANNTRIDRVNCVGATTGIYIGSAAVGTHIVSAAADRCSTTGVDVVSAVGTKIGEFLVRDSKYGIRCSNAEVFVSHARVRFVTNCGTNAGACGVFVSGGAILHLSDCDIYADNATAQYPTGVYASGAGTTVTARGLHVELHSGDAGTFGVGINGDTATGAVKLKLDDTTVDGTFAAAAGSLGVTVGAGGATVRIGRNVDLSGCNVPLTVPGGSYSNRGTVQLNGATPVPVAFPDLKATDLVKTSLTTVAGTQGPYPVIAMTPTTGFSITGTALDTSTYTYEIG